MQSPDTGQQDRVYSEQEILDLMAELESTYDKIRIVDPSRLEARNYDPETKTLGRPYVCYTAFGEGRCADCLAARVVTTKKNSAKFQAVGQDLYFIAGHYVDVEGTPSSIELITDVGDIVGSRTEALEFAGHVRRSTDAIVFDQLTGAHSRAYYDSALAGISECELAIFKVENLGRTNRALGYPGGDAMLKAICETIRPSMGENDVIARYEGDTFVIIFEDLAEDAFFDKVERICKRANDVVVPEYPSLRPDVRAAAVDELGVVRDLVTDALELMQRAELRDERVVLYSEHAKITDIARRHAEGEELLDHEELHRIESVDMLTGLLSLKAVQEELQDRLVRGDHHPGTLSVVVMDVEDFKSYNRRHGEVEGDMLLEFIADQVREAFAGDYAARFPVDRFVVLTHADDVEERVKQIHDAVADHSERHALELKAGIYVPAPDVTDAAFAVDRAVIACESIKGRFDRFVRNYDEDLDHHLTMANYITSNLMEAIAHGYVQVYYQPIVRAATGNVCDYEALSRWIDPKLGPLSPAEFIPVLERAHLVHHLDAFVVEHACARMARKLAEGIDVVPISVNLSRLDFQLCDMFEVVREAADRHHVPHDMLNIEITESTFDEDDFFHREVERFRNAGFEVWMDDFGSGYSSLNLLKDFRFEAIKIDMAFLSNFERNPESREIIATMVDMAKRLGMKTVAEGVSTEAQRGFLKRIGCEMLQGYLFDRPRAEEDPNRNTNLVAENIAERAYYNTVGRINLLGTRRGGGNDLLYTTESESRTMPIAVIEMRDDKLGYLNANEAYLRMVEDVHPEYLDLAHETLNAGAAKLLAPLEGLVRAGGEGHVPIDIGGVMHDVTVVHVATGVEADAYLVVVEESV